MGYLSTDDRLKGNDTTCDSNFLTFPGYNLEVEKTVQKQELSCLSRMKLNTKEYKILRGLTLTSLLLACMECLIAKEPLIYLTVVLPHC